MAVRRPLVLVAGRKKELPVSDTIAWELLSSLPVYVDAWGSINPSSKADVSALTNLPTQTGDFLVSKVSSIIGVGISGGRNGGLANYASNGIGDVGIFVEHAGGRVRLRPDGRLSAIGELIASTTGLTWSGNTCYHAGNHGNTGDPHTQYYPKPTGTSAQFLRGDGVPASDIAGDFRVGGATPLFGSGRELVVSAGISGDNIAHLSLQGSRTTAVGSFAVVNYYHQATRVAALAGFRDGADDAGGFQIVTKAAGVSTAVALQVGGDRHWRPGTDNVQNVGAPVARIKEVFAGASAINTSDARHKTQVRAFTNQEIAAAIALGDELGVYQWLEAIDAKGEIEARLHPGMTVQRAIEVMESHGLDPMRYAFICYDEWPEVPEILNCWSFQPRVVDDFGDLVREQVDAGVEVVQEYRAAGDLYSFRMALLLAFIAAGERAARLAALANIEARLAAAELALGLGA
ncbi:tail fiber domain-containing protein [Stenotrophomonas sp. PS02298]|uniref:tail fiber domain-containing protein n=1 Tax=Stenotrophomonas sp. PS02298 TaxID=2991424 RepID=UPI00249B0F05|nr:tail fiber domain-containing protein [Stenotrophomonas sp. PS02298]